MKRAEFNFPSADGATEIHCIRWSPDGEVRAVLQIAHGMVEHIARYEDFAAFLCNQGILVTGNDHLGHGRSVTEPQMLAHFPKGGNEILLTDMHTLRGITAGRYSGIPYFLLGHSMGSFLARQYISLQGNGLAGAVIMGTGEQPAAAIRTASALSGILGKIQGKTHHSDLLTGMAFGSYTKKIPDAPTGYEWLSVNPENVERYVDDPLCGLTFTNQAFRELFAGMLELKKKKNLKAIPSALPILLVSGAEDPVGDYGKAPEIVEKSLREAGVRNIRKILYAQMRHEILNEKDREKVYADICEWIGQHLEIY